MDWQHVVAAYATYVAALAWLRPCGSATRLLATAALAAALLLAAWPGREAPWARATISLIGLLVGYHLAGLVAGPPSAALERRLAAGDAWLAARLGTATLVPANGAVRRGLELAYLVVYPMLPIGAWVLHRAGAGDADARYWTAVLAAGLVSYGMLPWLTSRTPRALEPPPPGDDAVVRQVNLALLARFSTGLDTVTSGHAATSSAAAVVIAGHVASPLVAIAFAALALAIAVGTVTGRYHFAIDSAAGVALGVACGWLVG